MLIKYKFATGEVTEVEVSEEIGAVIIDLDRQEYNIDHKETRRHCSLDAYNLDDSLLPSDVDVARDFERADERKRLYAAIARLQPQQQELVRPSILIGRKSWISPMKLELARQQSATVLKNYGGAEKIFELRGFDFAIFVAYL